MKRLLRISLFLLFATIFAGCGIGTNQTAGGPGESGEDVVQTGDLVSESGITELASDNEIDEDAEKNVGTEEETQIADPILDEKPADTTDKTAEKDTDEYSSETSVKDDSLEDKDTDKDTEKNDKSSDDSTTTKDDTEKMSDESPDKDTTTDGSDIVSSNEKTDEEMTDKADPTTAITGNKVAITMDTTQGRWFETPRQELFSTTLRDDAKKRIKALRGEIKTIKKNAKNGKIAKETARDQVKNLRDRIAAEREAIGSGGRVQKGIHTYWANQSLNLRIEEGETGWYKLVVVAKNLGPLPEGYDRFSFTLLDKSSQTMLGNFSVKASEKVYHRGRTIFKLENPKGKVLDLLWNNDALDSKGDANVQIKAVRLKKIKEPRFTKKPIRKGDEYSYLDGRWFFEKKNAYTCWANQTIGYTFYNLKEGTYELEVMVMNRSQNGLPDKYEGFRVEVNTENNSDEMLIKASDKKWNKEKVSLILPEGDSTIYLTWLNDRYLKDQYDANIMIKQIKLKRTADSGMTAYLLKTTTGNRMIIMTILALLLITIGSISFYNRRKAVM